jgi:hypothetical protein
MSDEERRERKARFGDYPPDRPDSIVARLWKKHMRPWHPGMGDRDIKLTKEEEARLLAKIDEMMEAVDSAKRNAAEGTRHTRSEAADAARKSDG